MYINQSHLLAAFAGLCAAALMAGIWGLIAGQGAIAALVFAVILLVIAQLVLFVVVMKTRDDTGAEETDTLSLTYLQSIDQRLEQLELLSNQNAQLAEPASAEQPLLRADQGADTASSIMPQAAHGAVTEHTMPVTSAPFTGPYYLDETRLSLFLEPVVEIGEMQTGFYRAELSVLDEAGTRSFLSQLEETIAADGNSAEADLKLFARLGPVVARLAQKRQVTGVICPISQFSFANETFLQELTRHLQLYPDLARLMVIEISQSNLAGLSEDGMAGLAFLAQAGATFCLGGAGLESPDLSSLHSLGFRYLDLDYHENITRYGFSAFGPGGQALDLRETAHQLGIAIIGSGLERKSQADALNSFIDYGRGTAFSPPRLVRTDLGTGETSLKAA